MHCIIALFIPMIYHVDCYFVVNELSEYQSYVKKVRAGAIYLLISLLAGSALLAIVAVLQDDFGEFQVKVLLTTAIVGFGCICVLCCSAHARRTRSSIPGFIGFTFALLSTWLLSFGLWNQVSGTFYWKSTTIVSLFAFAVSHSLALLSERLKPSHRWLQWSTAVNILAIAVILSVMVVFEYDDETVLKILVALAILGGLGTLVIPILARVAKIDQKAVRHAVNGSLVLQLMEDGMYEDNRGRRYHVKQL